MRYREITPPPTHPYIAVLKLDPYDVDRLRRRMRDAPEAHILGVDDRQPDWWTVRLACASRRVAEMIEDGWG